MAIDLSEFYERQKVEGRMSDCFVHTVASISGAQLSIICVINSSIIRRLSWFELYKTNIWQSHGVKFVTHSNARVWLKNKDI